MVLAYDQLFSKGSAAANSDHPMVSPAEIR